MTANGEQQPSGAPEYKTYRTRRGLLPRLRKPDLSRLRERAKDAGRRPWHRIGGGRREGEEAPFWRRALKWVAVAAGFWLLISVISFAASSWLQSTKLADDADAALSGGGFALTSPQTILVIGTDARVPETQEPGAAPSEECFEQQSRGEEPQGDCSEGQFRADTLLLVRAGGGVFRKLSIPRDSFAEVPGQTAQKINGAYAFGGAALQIETVEAFLGIEIDHVVIIDFQGFEEFIDAIGGVEVDVPRKLCAEISGGAGGGQGGITLRIGKGEQTLDGQKALAYARVRNVTPCPGPGKSAFANGYSDFDRTRAQQEVLNGIKGRLTSIWRIPYNFIKGPIIGWEAPQALVSDMGPFTLSQLALSSAVASSGETDVLCAGVNAGCGPGPASSIEVPDSERRRAVDKLLNG
jgi:LCP family protein required for cell wall assembly